MLYKNAKILGVNKKPKINTYSHHAFINSIISNNDILRLKVNNTKKYYWEIISNDTCVENIGNYIEVKEKENCNNREGLIFRKCNYKDELIIHLDMIDLSNVHPIVNLFISGSDPYKCIMYNDKIFRMGIHRYGVMITENNKVLLDIPTDINEVRDFKIKKKGNRVCSYIRSADGQWENILDTDVNCIQGDMFIGINYNNLGSEYKKTEYKSWLYMNYIQLVYYKNEDAEIGLNYFIGPIKNYRYETLFAYEFLDIRHIRMNEVKAVFSDIHQYIKHCIDNDYYLSISLDEYYIPKRQAYKKSHFYHYNLIYGYDEESGEYYTAGYSSKLAFNTVPFEAVDRSGIENGAELIKYRMNTDTINIEFNMEYIISAIKEYVYGYASDVKYANITGCKKDTYGINIFNEILYTEKGKELLVNDVRISYLLYEHCMLMMERLDFIIKYGYLVMSDSKAVYMEKLCGDMVNAARAVNLMVVKNKIREIDRELIFKACNKLYDSEKKFYTALLNVMGED